MSLQLISLLDRSEELWFLKTPVRSQVTGNVKEELGRNWDHAAVENTHMKTPESSPFKSLPFSPSLVSGTRVSFKA